MKWGIVQICILLAVFVSAVLGGLAFSPLMPVFASAAPCSPWSCQVVDFGPILGEERHYCLEHCKRKCWDPETGQDWDIVKWRPVPCPSKACKVRLELVGDSTTSLLIAKLWTGHDWQHPQYMKPEGDHWAASYELGPEEYRIGLFQRGLVRGQVPIWVTYGSILLVCGERLTLVVENLI